jgi:hypothetical protein
VKKGWPWLAAGVLLGLGAYLALAFYMTRKLTR